jgi:subtilisin family serine protease
MSLIKRPTFRIAGPKLADRGSCHQVISSMSLIIRYLVAGACAWAALPGGAEAASDPALRSTWLVSFAEPPLASFRGSDAGGVALKATSPAVTGHERLDVAAPAAQAYRKHLGDLRSQRLQQAERMLGRGLQPQFVYDVVTNGVALELSDAEALRLGKLPGVVLVEREEIHEPLGDAGPQWIAADTVWTAGAGLGTRGAGRVVGIIDTGINRTHPAFAATGPVDGFVHANPRGRFFGLCQATPSQCNAKLIGIHDFTTCTGTHNTSGCKDEEANDGSDVDSHGSHVAATAVGNVLNANLSSLVTGGTSTVRVSGVAPHASVISYKACEKEAKCRGSWTLAAIEQAVADGVDVVNYSIGGSAVDPWSSTSARAMLTARDANVLFVVAAGNDGPGVGSVTSPANSPWVMAVANSTHNRVIANRLLDLSGGASAPPAGGVLLGAGLTDGYGPAPVVVPNDHPGCSVGSGDTELPPTGASNPWGAGRFAGEIVVCQRGTQARVAKSNNVRLAGGGGMVLVNMPSDGESTVADQHSIPSTHLGFTRGRALTDWLAGGSGHRGRIEGARLILDANLGDVLSSSSGRGPVAAGDFLKPMVAAPGSSILAAAGSGNGFSFKSGTSMASPHVAGAATLLRAARPTWTVTDIESALATTAHAVLRDSDGVTPASAMQQGAGRVDVGAALRAGLSFPVQRSDFDAANAASGGDSRALNQPALVHSRCVGQCSFTRRVRDIAGGGIWRAEFIGIDGLSVSISPQQFTLAGGATQTLAFQVTAASSLIGRWAEGHVQLRRIDGSEGTVAVTRVPVSVYASPGVLPTRVDVTANAVRGHADVSLGLFSGLAALSDLRVQATAPAVPRTTTRSLLQDTTRDDAYDNIGNGSFFELYTVPATPTPRLFRLTATTSSPTSADVDLFVGIDSNGNGRPESSEQRCRSIGPDANETCVFELWSSAQVQTLWVLVQNHRAGVSGFDDVRLDTVLADLSPAADLAVVVSTVSSTTAGAPFPLRVGWHIPDLQPGQQRVSQLRMSIGDNPPFADLPLWISHGSTAVTSPQVLRPGKAQRLTLAAGAAHDRLIVDVPANARALVLRTQSDATIELHAARVETPAGPSIAPAPARAQAQASTLGAGGNAQLRIEGAQLQPGRWYVTPVNAGTQAATLDLFVDIEYGGPRVPMSPGAYFNPERSGAGAFLYELGGAWGFIWYTFLQDGTPTWYLGAAPRPTAEQGLWRVHLDRFVWNGSEAIPTEVGEAILSFREPDAFQFSWNLDGQSGSERYQRIDTGPCPAGGLDATGIWFSPQQPGFGYSINVSTTIETYAAYFYDAQGIARWLFGAAPFGSPIRLQTHVGFCPLCEHKESITVDSGTLTRSFDANGAAGRVGVQFAWPAPLSGNWQVDLPAVRMTDPVGCR